MMKLLLLGRGEFRKSLITAHKAPPPEYRMPEVAPMRFIPASELDAASIVPTTIRSFKRTDFKTFDGEYVYYCDEVAA